MEHALYNLIGFVGFTALVFALGREWQAGAPRRAEIRRELERVSLPPREER